MSSVPIDQIKIGNRLRKDIGDLSSLISSIQDVGLLHPVVVSEDWTLIAGFRRLEAVKKLGWDKVPVNIVPLKDLAKGEFQENAVRKDFTVSEIVAIKRLLEPEIKAEAKERQGTRTDLGKELSPNLGRSSDIIANFAGISHGTLDKAEQIVKAAESDPEHFGKLLSSVDSGKTSINHAMKQVMIAQRHHPIESMPNGQYDVIYADPPWQYDLPLRGNPDIHYKTMTTEDIASLTLPIPEDAILFLWATNPKLEDALKVMSAWGFQYKTNMVWVKEHFGNGYYVRGQHELLLIGRRGNIPVPEEANRPSSIINAPTTEHSVKPQTVYEIIERMYPGRKYLELFARNTRQGWESWGDELEA